MLLAFADFLVRGAVGLARIVGLSPLIIGLTVVAFGTSAPEFVTAFTATLDGAPAMATGTIVGSNIANILLILGIAAVTRPIACSRRIVGRDGMVVLLVAVVFAAIAMFGDFSRSTGLALLAGLIAYVAITYGYERRVCASASLHALETEEISRTPGRPWVALAMLAAGIAGIVVGADLLVDGAVDIARTLGVSDALIGLTLIAVGTSLPELATALMASWRNHGDVALGNVLGSNIFNVLAIAGGVSVVSPIVVPAEIVRFDIWVMLASSALLLPLMISDRRISRREGGALLFLYAAFLAWNIALAADTAV
jgi:cation:H+ antiporter